MEESVLALVLKECLAAMEQGGEPEAIADRYPAVRSDILPLLKVAARLRATADAPPIPTEFLRDLGKQIQQADLLA